jgi:hypothetical protein
VAGQTTKIGEFELGKDAFHRVPDFARNEWDAVERVLTITDDWFRGGIALDPALLSNGLKSSP